MLASCKCDTISSGSVVFGLYMYLGMEQWRKMKNHVLALLVSRSISGPVRYLLAKMKITQNYRIFVVIYLCLELRLPHKTTELPLSYSVQGSTLLRDC